MEGKDEAIHTASHYLDNNYGTGLGHDHNVALLSFKVVRMKETAKAKDLRVAAMGRASSVM